MKSQWTEEELVEHFILLPTENQIGRKKEKYNPARLYMGPGRASKKTLEWEIKKLKDLKMLELPDDLFI
ncbi:hypothetical protein [Shouchella shacheensis]|uniref:hypothetical protein n=1 Tax=Shouchella shacheensis TaxID=1649580 RepID=UPI000B17B577|nr:hypothetical protein [Shouchella shacheensis]